MPLEDLAIDRPTPFCTFLGYLKQIVPDGLDDLRRAALAYAFPRFWNMEHPTDDMKSFMAQLEQVGADEITWQKQQNRRFSGGEDLPRGRYYSLSKDELGDDEGTLVDELTAYMSPKKFSQFILFDLAYSVSVDVLRTFGIKTERQKAIILLFAERPGDPNPFIDIFRERLIGNSYKHPTSSGTYFPILIPYLVEKTCIEKVMDLRQLQAQDWFVQKFGRERGNVYVEFEFPEQLAFVDLLVWLLSPSVGGDAFTEGVGYYLRHQGANALIYPSARSEIGVVHEHSELVDWSGWNLVDFRGASDVSTKVVIDLTGAQPLVVSPDLELRYVDQGRLQGSWHLKGLRKRHRRTINPTRS